MPAPVAPPPVEELRKLHEAGTPHGRIGEHYGVTRPTVAIWLERAGIRERPKQVAMPSREELEALAATMKRPQVAQHYGVSVETIRRWRSRLGITDRAGNEQGEAEPVEPPQEKRKRGPTSRDSDHPWNSASGKQQPNTKMLAIIAAADEAEAAASTWMAGRLSTPEQRARLPASMVAGFRRHLARRTNQYLDYAELRRLAEDDDL